MNKKLKIGILLDSFKVQNWVYELIKNLSNLDFLSIELIIYNKSMQNVSNDSLFQKMKRNYNGLLYLLYLKFEKLILEPFAHTFELKDLRDILSNNPTIEVSPIKKKFSDYFQVNDIHTIKQYDLDVILRFGFRLLKGNILKCAKAGIWSFHHGDNTTLRGGPEGIWEVIEQRGEIGSILQILDESVDNGNILYRSWSATDKWFTIKTNSRNYWKTNQFIPRTLKKLYDSGIEEFTNNVKMENSHPTFYSYPNYTVPSHMMFIKFLILHYLKYLYRKIWSLFNFEQWVLLYAFNNKNKGPVFPLFRFKKIIPPKDRIWSDPHVIFNNDKYHIFIEEMLLSDSKGYISHFILNKDGSMSQPTKILEKPYHLSYPFVFFHDNQYYMIPESSANRDIQLYRSANFPYDWEFVDTLMDNGVYVDTTVFLKDNKWWLFTGKIESDFMALTDELYLYYSDSLFSKNWISHPQNPIVSDVKSARPAGKIFTFNNKLYRPSQNSKKRYGYAVKINQIEILNEKEYKESCVNEITPNWDKKILGLHTLNFENEITLFDAEIRRRRF